ncbi:MAG: phage tail tube protein [Candidatus Kapaibacterium sp.]
MASASQTRLAHIAEVTYGVTPATPTFIVNRYTAENLNSNIQTVTSNEIRADRNVTDVIQTGSEVGGSVDFEMSYGSFDPFLESLMFNTYATNVLKNGQTQRSFTLEKTFETGATDQFHRLTGCVVNEMSLAIQAQQIVTGSFGFLGAAYTTAQAAIASSTYTAANTNPVISAGANFASLTMTGVTSPALTALSLNVTNNLKQQPVIGSLVSRGINPGRFEVTGNFTAYFENQQLFDIFLAQTVIALSFQIGGASTLRYTFDVARIKLTSAEVVAGGNDQDVMAVIGFRGLYDNTDNTLKITRAP